MSQWHLNKEWFWNMQGIRQAQSHWIQLSPLAITLCLFSSSWLNALRKLHSEPPILLLSLSSFNWNDFLLSYQRFSSLSDLMVFVQSSFFFDLSLAYDTMDHLLLDSLISPEFSNTVLFSSPLQSTLLDHVVPINQGCPLRFHPWTFFYPSMLSHLVPMSSVTISLKMIPRSE